MRLVCISIVLLFLFSCNSVEETSYKNLSPKQFFTQAKEDLNSNLYESAIKKFRKIQTLYPASKFAKQARLELAYALFQNNNYQQAINELDNYIRLYPSGQALDYAYYMRGIISEEQSKSFLDKIIIDEAQKNTQGTKKSIKYYKQLIQKFPNSNYSLEASNRLIRLQNKIARHELLVAHFYYRKQNYIAAINRLKFLIKNYPRTASIPFALKLLERIYGQMQMIGLQQDITRILDASYPNYIINLEELNL